MSGTLITVTDQWYLTVMIISSDDVSIHDQYLCFTYIYYVCHLYLHTHVCTHTYTHMYTYTNTHTNTHTHIHTKHAYIHCMYTHYDTYMYTHKTIYVCMCVCIYVLELKQILNQFVCLCGYTSMCLNFNIEFRKRVV